ncbi:MAG: cytochrome c3 family protein [Desulfocapsaceae bacterium]|nr:cytochrome c3 family protein [Desulfocapsaceae bacterium]
MKKFHIGAAILIFCCSVGGTGFAADTETGPAEITLQTTIHAQKVARPAFFPHATHQGLADCKTCHHGQGSDGKLTPYVKGQKIEKCETCHNDKTNMPENLANLRRISHKLCIACHLENDKELIKCGVCHPKK